MDFQSAGVLTERRRPGEQRVLWRQIIKWAWPKCTIIITGNNFGNNENKHDLYSPVFQSSSPFQ